MKETASRFLTALRRRGLDERGFVTGSLAELLSTIPIALILAGAGLGLALMAQKGEARSEIRHQAMVPAQRALDQVSTELRAASTLEWVAPTPGYALQPGWTNTIKATTIVSWGDSQPHEVTYTCGLVFATASACTASYVAGGQTVKVIFLPEHYPTGTAISSRGGTDTQGFGAFHLMRNGRDNHTAPNFVDIRFDVCLNRQDCGALPFKNPVELRAGVAPRNLAPATGPCANYDPADDPQGGC